MKSFQLQGTITALVTPFTNKGSVDFKALEKLIDFQIENKVEGILVCGTTGESPTLTTKEKMAVIIRAVEYSAGRIPIIAGTGTYETHESLDLTTYAQEEGADAALLVTPYYNKPTQDGLFEHFYQIANAVNIPIIIYNIPGRTGVNMLPVTQLRLASSCSNVIGTKEASGNLNQMMEIIKNAPPHFKLMSGDDSLTLPIISIGGAGIISVLSNYAPKQFGDMVRLALKGKFIEAMKKHYELLELMNLNFIESNPSPVKYSLSLMKLINEKYRMPMMPMTNTNKKLMKEAMQKAGLI